MKALFVALLLIPTLAQAKEHKFVWKTKDVNLEFKTSAETWEVAYERAAQFCFKYLVEKETKLTTDRGLDIIDLCANPR